jgi:hypothetical protein
MQVQNPQDFVRSINQQIHGVINFSSQPHFGHGSADANPEKNHPKEELRAPRRV